MSDAAVRHADVSAVVVVAATWAGAVAARPVPLPALVGVGIVGLVAGLGPRRVGRVAIVAAAVAVVASGLGARSLAGLHPAVEGAFDGTAVLVTDPEPTPSGRVRADVRVAGTRLLAEARAPAAVDALAGRLAGEAVAVRGEVRAFEEPMAWAQARHLAGRLRVDAVDGHGPPAVHAAAANGIRRLLERGASSLPDRHRALLAGLTLGDDRAQPPELAADFRAAGLSHLLAVSGANVVFVLAVAGPLLRRLRVWPRFVVAVLVVLGFAFVTRFEPSVVRAAAMATVALWASTTGRRAGGLRHLAIAVTALLLVDPLLARSVGFRLSVAACLGVLLIAPRLAGRLPGPRWAREALAMTVAAQVAVAPVLVPTFGALPLAALPANVAAAPLAAGLMVWGVTAGSIAGVVGGPVAAALHLPSALGLAALELVAAWGAALPLGHVDLRHVAVLAAAAPLLARPGAARGVGAALVAAVLVLPAAVPVPPGATAVGWAATVWSDGPVAVVEVGPGSSAVDVLEVLRRRRVRVVGLLVVVSAREQPAEVVRAVRARMPVRAVVAPPGSPVPDHVVPEPGTVVRVGGFEVQVDDVTPTLVARVGWSGSGPAAGRR